MTPRDTLDLGEVFSVLRRGRRWIVSGAALGLLAAVAATLVLPPRYEGRSTVLLRNLGDPASTSSLVGGGGSGSGGFSVGGFADLFSRASGFDTELEILTSRSVLTSVIDSLGLQVRVLRPRGISLETLFSLVFVEPDAVQAEYRFQRQAGGYRVSGGGWEGAAEPGVPVRLNGATVTLRSGELPDAFTIRVMDLDVAVDRLVTRLNAGRAGGEIAELTYRADDPVMASAVPNAIVEKYLGRRRTTDRGLNQRRYEILLVQTDSIRDQLTVAGQRLRQHQEASGVLDPALVGKAESEYGLTLRTELDTREVEKQALQRTLAEASAGRLSARELGAYPTFLRNPAVNELLSRLTELESRRTELLDRRTENDPDVIVLDQTARQVESQLVSIARAYLQGVTAQQTQLREELRRYDATVAALPAAAETSFRLARDVERLAQTLVALETQLVQARLAAMTEGGDVRLVDGATQPRKPTFPNPWVNLAVGLFGGLMLGAVAALGRGYLGNALDARYQAELATGVPAADFEANAPLILRSGGERQSVLLVPIGDGVAADPVARSLAATAALQDRRSVVVSGDMLAVPGMLTPPSDASGVLPVSTTAAVTVRSEPDPEGAFFVYRGAENGGRPVGPLRALQELEQHFSLVVTVLPSLDSPMAAAVLSSERTVVLVAQAGSTRRDQLRLAVQSLERIGIPVAGVVFRGRRHGDPRA